MAEFEVKNVPLVTYRENGEWVEIGSAEVRSDGTVTARVEVPEFTGLLSAVADGFSFGPGASMPDQDASMADALAALREENRQLRRERDALTQALAEELQVAQAIRAEVAELARRAGELLKDQP